jgi:hypothetical protein
MSIRITFANLWTHVGDDHERGPLTMLEQDGELGHIHGRLEIVIDGRAVPELGFFGDADVCFDDWLVELCAIVKALEHDGAIYTFDDCDQGQPAFAFERRNANVIFSIVAGSGGGSANSEWQRVSFDYDAFRAEVVRFVEALRTELRREIPSLSERWWPAAATL